MSSKTLEDREDTNEEAQGKTRFEPEETNTHNNNNDNNDTTNENDDVNDAINYDEANETIPSNPPSDPLTDDETAEVNHNANADDDDDDGNATDSTLSDAGNNQNTTGAGASNNAGKHVNDDATESETSDNELILDDIDEDYPCKWENCEKVLNSPKLLTLHIRSDHVRAESALQCKWLDCVQEFKDKHPFLVHLRSHTNYQPYFCPVSDCLDKFASSMELANHLRISHDNSFQEKVAWQSFLNEIVLPGAPEISVTNIEDFDTLSRIKLIGSSKLLKDHLTKPKIDFLKIQNVQVDDIVSEPVKKKGRTANSVINADLRSAFNEIDGAYKQELLKVADESANENQELDSEQLPSFETINSLNHTDQLAFFHSSLQRKLLWGLEAQTFLKKDLDELQTLEKELWNKKEILLQTNIDTELPINQEIL